MTTVSRWTLALLLTAAFVALAAIGGPSNGWDAGVASWFAQVRLEAPGATRWAAIFTTAGGAYATLGASLVATLWLVAKHMPRRALLFSVAILLERLLVTLLKGTFDRPRPQLEHLPASFAFPSGHAANSMTAYLAIALIAVPRRHRRWALIAALAITLLVGATRILLGVHWTSDVFGGWILGLLAVGLAVTIEERSAALHLEAQHDVVARHGPPVDENESA